MIKIELSNNVISIEGIRIFGLIITTKKALANINIYSKDVKILTANSSQKGGMK